MNPKDIKFSYNMLLSNINSLLLDLNLNYNENVKKLNKDINEIKQNIISLSKDVSSTSLHLATMKKKISMAKNLFDIDLISNFIFDFHEYNKEQDNEKDFIKSLNSVLQFCFEDKFDDNVKEDIAKKLLHVWKGHSEVKNKDIALQYIVAILSLYFDEKITQDDLKDIAKEDLDKEDLDKEDLVKDDLKKVYNNAVKDKEEPQSEKGTQPQSEKGTQSEPQPKPQLKKLYLKEYEIDEIFQFIKSEKFKLKKYKYSLSMIKLDTKKFLSDHMPQEPVSIIAPFIESFIENHLDKYITKKKFKQFLKENNFLSPIELISHPLKIDKIDSKVKNIMDLL